MSARRFLTSLALVSLVAAGLASQANAASDHRLDITSIEKKPVEIITDPIEEPSDEDAFEKMPACPRACFFALRKCGTPCLQAKARCVKSCPPCKNRSCKDQVKCASVCEQTFRSCAAPCTNKAVECQRNCK
jgi:hypothetical protein